MYRIKYYKLIIHLKTATTQKSKNKIIYCNIILIDQIQLDKAIKIGENVDH